MGKSKKIRCTYTLLFCCSWKSQALQRDKILENKATDPEKSFSLPCALTITNKKLKILP